jgi:hypothetical protein
MSSALSGLVRLRLEIDTGTASLEEQFLMAREGNVREQLLITLSCFQMWQPFIMQK